MHDGTGKLEVTTIVVVYVLDFVLVSVVDEVLMLVFPSRRGNPSHSVNGVAPGARLVTVKVVSE